VEGVECLVQCGTNLSMVKVADEVLLPSYIFVLPDFFLKSN